MTPKNKKLGTVPRGHEDRDGFHDGSWDDVPMSTTFDYLNGVYLGNSNGGFVRATPGDHPGLASLMEEDSSFALVADLNGDGLDDLFLVSKHPQGHNSVYFQARTSEPLPLSHPPTHPFSHPFS